MQGFGERNAAACLRPRVRAQSASSRDDAYGARARDGDVLAAALLLAGTPPASLFRGLRVLAVVLLLGCLLGGSGSSFTSLWLLLLLNRLSDSK